MARITKTIAVVLDGLEPSLFEPVLRAGTLPHLPSLQLHGGYVRLATTYPARIRLQGLPYL